MWDLKKMSARIGGGVIKKQELMSSNGEIVKKKEVNMIKAKKNLKRGYNRRRMSS